MSWVRNNVSKAISQKRAFNTSLSTYQPNFETVTRSEPPQKNTIIKQDDLIKKEVKISVEPIFSCMKNIDAILYINLEHRKDRLQHIINEIKKINPEMSKAHRINAIYKKDNGALGCSLSHIQALQFFMSNPSWNTCMILEDDFTFTSSNSNEINTDLNSFFSLVKDFDILLLGTGVTNYECEDTDLSSIKRVLSSQTTSGYIVSRKYVFTLLANYLKGSNLMKKEGFKEEYCLDQYWKQLMPLGKWFTLDKKIGFQYNSYSDIEKKVCDYNC